jgi:hypothetical protein
MVSWNLVEFFLDRIQMTGLVMEMTGLWMCLMMCWTLALKVNGFHFIRKRLPMDDWQNGVADMWIQLDGETVEMW